MEKSSVFPPAAARAAPSGEKARARTTSSSVKLLKISSIARVSARMGMRVGVAVPALMGGSTGLKVAVASRMSPSVAGEVGAGRARMEKLQDASSIVLRIKPEISRDHGRGFNAFSLST